jgi:hypothetical protein
MNGGVFMKKIISAFILLSLLVLVLPFSSFGAFAESESVYASKDTQEIIYKMTQDESFEYYDVIKTKKLTVLKESITPVYYVDMLEFAKTGVLDIKPDPNPSRSDYLAKVIDERGDFFGNLEFTIEDGKLTLCYFRTIEDTKPGWVLDIYNSSISYADHAERIRRLLDRDEIVSPSDVRYVMLDRRGAHFSVKTESGYVFISLGKHEVGNTKSVVFSSVYYEEGLKAAADAYLIEYEEYLIELEKYREEHNGEIFTGYPAPNLTPDKDGDGISENIINIAEYFKKSNKTNSTDNSSESSTADNGSDNIENSYSNNESNDTIDFSETDDSSVNKTDDSSDQKNEDSKTSDEERPSIQDQKDSNKNNGILLWCAVFGGLGLILGSLAVVFICRKKHVKNDNS